MSVLQQAALDSLVGRIRGLARRPLWPFPGLLVMQWISPEGMSELDFPFGEVELHFQVLRAHGTFLIVLFLPLDIEKLCTFSQRFPLPSMYRALVWKVLLGMRPGSGDSVSKVLNGILCHLTVRRGGLA